MLISNILEFEYPTFWHPQFPCLKVLMFYSSLPVGNQFSTETIPVLYLVLFEDTTQVVTPKSAKSYSKQNTKTLAISNHNSITK